MVTDYHPPEQTVERGREMIDYLTNGLDHILRDRTSSGIVTGGDFNKLNRNGLCTRFNLRKLVKSAARGTNILDQILTNMSDLFCPVQHLPPLGKSENPIAQDREDNETR